jgi:cobalt/nickel transport system permease protein
VSGPHVHSLTVHAHSPVHHLPARVKIAAMFVFVLAVVATPAEQMWAFAVHALLLVGVVVLSEIPFGHLLRRVALETPFLLFAVFLPLVGGGPRIEVAGLSLSQEGLWAAWTIVAKATLGVTASVILVSTTEVPHLLRGLGQLRVPAVMVAIAGFMVRYLEVIAGELGRMRTAMAARGYRPRRLGQARALGMAGGALFVRSYERGERVHQAMLARGFQGVMPSARPEPAAATVWLSALAVPVGSWVIALAAMVMP